MCIRDRIRIVAVEPSECAAISGGFIGHHSIAGIGPGFVPENYNPYVVAVSYTHLDVYKRQE